MVSPTTPRSLRLVDQLVPRRGAARKADASFSAQFQSSSPEKVVSDTEEMFGEPTRSNNGKGKVKVRYGGRSNSTKGSTDGIRIEAGANNCWQEELQSPSLRPQPLLLVLANLQQE